MNATGSVLHAVHVPEFVIHHTHNAAECAAVFASFQGFVTPLRHRAAAASCGCGGHDIWWFVEAENGPRALELVPAYVARRAAVTRIERVLIP